MITRSDMIVVGLLTGVIVMPHADRWDLARLRELLLPPESTVDGVAAPPPELVDVVAPVRTAIRAAGNRSGAKAFGELQLGLAVFLEADDRIKSTAQLKEANQLAGKLLDSQIDLRMPGVAQAVATMWEQQISDGPLDGDRRRRAIEILKALAWAAVMEG